MEKTLSTESWAIKRIACGCVALVASLTLDAAPLSSYTIVKPADLSAASETVLKDFNDLLSKSLGAPLKVVTTESAPKENRIFFGLAPEGVSTNDFASQEFLTKIDSACDIYLVGGGPNGTRYAAYDFLETTLGYRFFDWRGGMRVPELAFWEPKPMTRRHAFSFEVRGMSSWWHFTGREWALYMLRSGNNDSAAGYVKGAKLGTAVDELAKPHPNNSSLYTYLPRNPSSRFAVKWINDIIGCTLEKDHPECFSMDPNGKRNFSRQYCLSNPWCRALVKKIVFAQLARQTTPAFVDISAADSPGRFCDCPDCVALEKKYGTNGGPLIDVFMEFCPEVAKLYPQHRLMTLVYRKCQTQHPPKIAKMPDNFVPDFAPIDDDFSKDWTHPNNLETYEDLKTWGRMCKSGILMWYYPNPYGGEVTPPFGNVERLVNDIRLMHAAGTRYAGFEHNVGVQSQTGFTELQTYLMTHLFRDVNCDWRALMDEFIDFEYGAAAPGVKAYLAKLEELRKQMKNSIPWNASAFLGHYTYLTNERLVKWDGAFDRLEQVVRNDRHALRNLRRLRLNLDYVLVRRHAKIAADFPDWKTTFSDVLARIRTIMDEIEEDCYVEQYKNMAKVHFKKKIEDELWLMEIQNGKNPRPLPDEFFAGVEPSRITVTLPVGQKFDDKDAAYGVAMGLSGKSAPEKATLPLVANVETAQPVTWQPKIGPGVTKENLGPQGQYKFYDMGRATISPNCYVSFNCYGFRAYMNAAYEEGSFNKVRIYASFKFEGPAFYPGDTKPNHIWCDRVVIVKLREGEETKK